jgi:hypothetical protein
MTDKKRQHYVPQFYLRLFSSDGASIGLYNIPSSLAVPNASLKRQAYKNYYYGKDGKAEGSLSIIEGEASRVIREMLRVGRPPKRWSEGHHTLASYLMIQFARTVQAENDANEFANKLGKEMLRRSLTDPKLLFALDDVKITLTNAVALALRPALLEVPVILDLKFKLIHNTSGMPFITSDHPAVKHNDLFADEGREYICYWIGEQRFAVTHSAVERICNRFL